jgi:hypothetical protein
MPIQHVQLLMWLGSADDVHPVSAHPMAYHTQSMHTTPGVAHSCAYAVPPDQYTMELLWLSVPGAAPLKLIMLNLPPPEAAGAVGRPSVGPYSTERRSRHR